MKKYFDYIDSAKGLAIFTLVLGHVAVFGFCNEKLIIHCVPLMPLWFFLSGLVASTIIKNGIIGDVFKRFRSYIIPFFVIGLTFSLSFGNMSKFIFDRYHDGYWYLWVLFIFTSLHTVILNPLISKFAKIKYFDIMANIVLAAIWYISFRLYYQGNFSNSIFEMLSIPFVLMYYPYFLIGNIIKRFNLYSKLFNSSIILFISLYITLYKETINFPLSLYLTNTCWSVLIVSLCCKLSMIYKSNLYAAYLQRTLTILGKNSLYIYIFHYFAFPFMNLGWVGLILSDYDQSLLSKFVICLIPAFFAIMVSFACTYFFVKSESWVYKYLFGK